MIAKNEARSKLLTTLEAASLHITGYMFCDTGSTDGTPKLAKAFFQMLNIKGRVEHHQWRDFSYNRNLCLAAGRSLAHMCDYWLLLDADQIMVSEDDISLAELPLSEASYL